MSCPMYKKIIEDVLKIVHASRQGRPCQGSSEHCHGRPGCIDCPISPDYILRDYLVGNHDHEKCIININNVDIRSNDDIESISKELHSLIGKSLAQR